MFFGTDDIPWRWLIARDKAGNEYMILRAEDTKRPWRPWPGIQYFFVNYDRDIDAIYGPIAGPYLTEQNCIDVIAERTESLSV